MIDERTEELAALYALDLLESDEMPAFEARLANEPELRALVDQLRASAAALAHSVPSRNLPPHLESRIRQAVRESGPPQARSFVRPSWVPWAIAAALTVACVLLVQERGRLRRDVAKLESRDALARAQIATLSSKLASAPRATAVIIWDPEKQEGVLKAINVPANARDQDYQLWVVDPQYQQPVSAGVFGVDNSGVTKISFRPQARVKSVKAFAVSLERKGGVPKAEGPMVLAGE